MSKYRPRPGEIDQHFLKLVSIYLEIARQLCKIDRQPCQSDGKRRNSACAFSKSNSAAR